MLMSKRSSIFTTQRMKTLSIAFPIGVAKIIDESFEGTGYEESWTEYNSGGCTLNEDSAIPGATPPNAGSQCLNYVKISGANAYARRDYGSQVNTSYTRFYIYFSALSSSVSQEEGCILAMSNDSDEDANTTMNFGIYNDAGTHRWRLAVHFGAGWSNAYSSSSISTDTWYRVEIKIDDSGTGSHQLLVDGDSQGILAGNLDRGAPRYWYIGYGGYSTSTVSFTTYYDLFAVSTEGWIGEDQTTLSGRKIIMD